LQISEITKGSENSLLMDDDQWQGRGYDEDGSFRGGYRE
jgi:hypothetical protein